MPETITQEITLYTFNELSDKAKEKARKWYAEGCYDNYWSECVIADATQDGTAQGFDIDKVYWSGFWSQGDGASWSGSVHLDTFIDYHLKEDNPDHARYVVLRELLRNDWLSHRVDVRIGGNFYQHSGVMCLDDYDDSTLAYLIDDDGGERMYLDTGVLAGADVRQLAEGITYEELVEKLLEWVITEAREFADKIYANLEEAYEWEISDEHIAEMADANEWRFEEDGSFSDK